MYRLRETGAVMTISEVLARHRNTSFPLPITAEILSDFGYDPVLQGPQPQAGRYETVEAGPVEQDANGNWVQTFVTAPLDDEAKFALDAQQAASTRQQRNLMLSETDWTQGKDIPDAISGPWATYRQALRDVPSQSGFPWEVTWPTKPE